MEVPNPTTNPPLSPTTDPLPLLGQSTCDVLQAVSTEQDECHVDPNSCRSMICHVYDIRVNMTVLPCGETQGVNVDAYHVLEEVALVNQDFNSSQRSYVDFGETVIFYLDVTVEQFQSQPDEIIFMVSQFTVG